MRGGSVGDVEGDDFSDLLPANRTLPVRSHHHLGAPEAHAHVLARFAQSVLVKSEANDTFFLAVVVVIAL